MIRNGKSSQSSDLDKGLYEFSVVARTNHHKLSSLKQHYLLSHNSIAHKYGYSVASLVPFFRVSQGRNQNISRPVSLTGGSGEESASKLTQVVGRIQFLLL